MDDHSHALSEYLFSFPAIATELLPLSWEWDDHPSSSTSVFIDRVAFVLVVLSSCIGLDRLFDDSNDLLIPCFEVDFDLIGSATDMFAVQ